MQGRGAAFPVADRGWDLTILHAAIWQHSGETIFFVNVDNDHWSSIDIKWAGRDDSRCQEITVRCVTLLELFETYGVPHTLKIDVEGVDLVVLQQLASAKAVPAFVSVEDCRFGFDYLRILSQVGYGHFKLLDQSEVPDMRDDRLGYQFRPGSSGPLGMISQGPGWTTRPWSSFTPQPCATGRETGSRPGHSGSIYTLRKYRDRKYRHV